jgi:hypothetical protein
MGKCVGWCPLCYANRRGRAAYKGHRYFSAAGGKGHGHMAKFVHRGGRKGPSGGDSGPVGLCDLVRRFEALVEYLTETVNEDGTTREKASLLIVHDQGQWKGWINDRDNNRTSWTSAATLTGLFEVLEDGLRNDDLDWRAARGKGRQK